MYVPFSFLYQKESISLEDPSGRKRRIPRAATVKKILLRNPDARMGTLFDGRVFHLEPESANAMPIKAAFFDIDGTLVDSNEFHVRAWEQAFRDHGVRIAEEEIRGQIGKGADQLIPSLVPGIEEREQQRLADRHAELFRTRYLELVKPFPHATDLVQLLQSKGKKVVLASSADKEEVDHYVGLLKIGHTLSGTISNDDVKNSKPAADIFAAALASVFPLRASETFAIGDTRYDVESALQSDIKTIALCSGGASEETLAEAGAAYVYASVKELFDNFDSSPLQA